MFKLAAIVINAALVFAIVWYGVGLYAKLHFQPAEATYAPPPSVPPRDGLREKFLAFERKVADEKQKDEEKYKAIEQKLSDKKLSEKISSLESSFTSFKDAQNLKADQYQCKTDPTLLARLSKLEKWKKDLEDATKKQNDRLEKLLHEESPPLPPEPEAKKVTPAPAPVTKLDWFYDIGDARREAKKAHRPILLAFNQVKELCRKCYSVRENCYKNARDFGEISRNFVPYWAPTGWSEMTDEYNVTGFPTVVIDYGDHKRSFVPSDDPDRFLEQLKEYE
jgi:ATP-dependent exoDNAse (exonuclease V) beta subunit